MHVIRDDATCGLIWQMEAAGERYTFCPKSGRRPDTEVLALPGTSRISLTKEDVEAGKKILVPLASAAVSESLITRVVRAAQKRLETGALAASQQRLFNFAVGIVAVSGIYIGAERSYSEDKRLDNLMVIKVLEDVTAWKGIANLLTARRNLDQAQDNIRVALQVAPEALFTKLRVHGREVRLFDLIEECNRQSEEVDRLLGRI